MSLRVKNWGKHQHFKDRTPPWIKLYREILDDLDWFQLDPEAAKILIGLWLIASEDETHEGILPDTKTLAFRLRVEQVRLDKALTKLNHWLIQDDIKTISNPVQDGSPETETETETYKKEKEKKPSGVVKPKTSEEPIPDPLRPVVAFLSSSWPKVSYGNGTEKRTVTGYSEEDLWAKVVSLGQKFGKVPGAILYCGVPYLRKLIKDSEETGRFRFAKDMSNFWGIKDGNRMWEDVYNQGLADFNSYMERARNDG